MEHIIRMDVREIGRECADWIHLTEDRDQWRAVVNMVMNLRVFIVAAAIGTQVVCALCRLMFLILDSLCPVKREAQHTTADARSFCLKCYCVRGKCKVVHVFRCHAMKTCGRVEV
jgi:hypothetical protein